MLATRFIGLSETGDIVKDGLFDKLSKAIANLNEWYEKNKE